MSYIAFVSTFPTEANMRDGYFRRVHNVDQVFRDEERIHLDIRFGKNLVKRIVSQEDRMQVMHLNAVFHFFRILSVLRHSDLIYIHSIAKVPSIWLQLMVLKRRVPLVLDLHGVMVDELKLAGDHARAWIFSRIEKFCFRWCLVTVNVSEVMKNHYTGKYPGYTGETLVFPANSIPANGEAEDPAAQETLRKQLGFNADDVIFLYSGNCQKWQNIDLMMDIIRKHAKDHYRFLILSGQKSKFEKLIRHYRIPAGYIRVLSLSPDDLWRYYQIAHYGFILRDDILVNRVANPTKLAEYLQYGIIPIVKLSQIGDYDQYRYEYVDYQRLDDKMQPVKSDKNKEVAREINKKHGEATIRQIITDQYVRH